MMEEFIKCPLCGEEHNFGILICPTTLKPIPGLKDDLIGNSLEGRFLVQEAIAKGFSGIIYKGIDTITGDKVAIKRFSNVELKEYNNTIIQKLLLRFKNEILILQKFSQNLAIPRYYSSGYFKNTPYLIMEYCEGDSLRDVLNEAERREFSPKEGVAILIKFLTAIEEFHANNLYHRDLKPENVIYNWKKDSIKIIDFGSARLFNGLQKNQITSTIGDIPTTPDYLGPELRELWDRMKIGDINQVEVKTKPIEQQLAFARRMDLDSCGHIVVEWLEDCFKRYGVVDKISLDFLNKFKQKAILLPMEERYLHIKEMKNDIIRLYNYFITNNKELYKPTVLTENHQKVDLNEIKLIRERNNKIIYLGIGSIILFLILSIILLLTKYPIFLGDRRKVNSLKENSQVISDRVVKKNPSPIDKEENKTSLDSNNKHIIKSDKQPPTSKSERYKTKKTVEKRLNDPFIRDNLDNPL